LKENLYADVRYRTSLQFSLLIPIWNSHPKKKKKLFLLELHPALRTGKFSQSQNEDGDHFMRFPFLKNKSLESRCLW
jgi:hypothetical protein